MDFYIKQRKNVYNKEIHDSALWKYRFSHNLLMVLRTYTVFDRQNFNGEARF